MSKENKPTTVYAWARRPDGTVIGAVYTGENPADAAEKAGKDGAYMVYSPEHEALAVWLEGPGVWIPVAQVPQSSLPMPVPEARGGLKRAAKLEKLRGATDGERSDVTVDDILDGGEL